MSVNAKRPKPVSGGALQESIIALAQPFGWKIAHFRPCKTNHGWRTAVSADGKGWPDLYMVNPARAIVIYREIKGQYEKVSPEQSQWGDWLTEAAQDWKVWRPRDWDEIVSTLTFGRGSAQ